MGIGLFFARAGGLIEQAVDLEQLAGEFGTHFPVSLHDDFFNPRDLGEIVAKCRSQNLDGVLLIGESPLSYQSRRAGDLIRSEIEALGINPNKIGFVNLKEQVALVHPGQKPEATRKARLLIDAAIERVRIAETLEVVPVAPRKAVAVIGATAAGYLAAQQLLQKGFTVYLLEPRSGSTTTFLPDERLRPVWGFTENHPRFRSYLGAGIKDFYGYAGDYALTLELDNASVVLAPGAVVVADPADRDLTRKLRHLLHIDIDANGHFAPRNRDTLQAYSTEEGIFLALNDPNDLGRTAAAADGAVLAVAELLECPEIRHTIAVSGIESRLCGACGTCIKTCLFHASKIDLAEKHSVIDPKRCKGCGNCVTSCPTGARDLLTYPREYLFKAIDTLARYATPEPKILVFLCEGGGYRALDAAGAADMQYPVGILPLAVRCGGAVDTQLILQAFKDGFDGVAICKCPGGHCSNIVGNLDLERRANLFREILASRGIDPDRLRIIDALLNEDSNCIAELIDFYTGLKEAGGEADE